MELNSEQCLKQTKGRTRDFLYLYQEARSHGDGGGMGERNETIISSVKQLMSQCVIGMCTFGFQQCILGKGDMGIKIRLGYMYK